VPENIPFIQSYHARTRHHFEAYAAGPGQLDWDAQPAPFRHFHGAPCLSLPLSADQFERPWHDPAPTAAVPAGLDSIGAVLELSFGLSAWKSWGPAAGPCAAIPLRAICTPRKVICSAGAFLAWPMGCTTTTRSSISWKAGLC